MERFILNNLKRWKESKYRKPLILKGIRQAGKTWALQEFGRLHYQNVAYFSFDEDSEYKQFFEKSLNVSRIIQNLAMAGGQAIQPEKTLLIFDEIQECPRALNALKYFCEDAPEYHVACAGSLLGVSPGGGSFPVGKVDFLEIYPMNFTEFLLANGDRNLAEYLRSIDEIAPLPDAFFNPLCEKLKMYYITGGMPEAVKMWTQERRTDLVQQVLSGIIGAYERDFSKHPAKNDIPKIRLIWKSLPSQLSRENKKFLYQAVKEGARAREYENALQWLCDAGLTIKVWRSKAPGLPLSAYDDVSAFKIYLPDVGLLRRLSLLAPSAFSEGNRLFTEFKGALSGNYVLQALAGQFEAPPRYWTMDNPRHEVDFLIQWENEIIPVEVKSETNTESRSLKKYAEKYNDKTRLRLRFSLRNLCLDGDVLNIPLILADRTADIIPLAIRAV
jgi:predicted AAA+ superfamily ATPase